MKLTIRKKLLALSFIAIVIPLIISGGAIYFIVSQKALNESLEKIRSNSAVATAQYSRRLAEIAAAAREITVPALQFDFVGTFNKAPAAGVDIAQKRREVTNILESVQKDMELDYLILTDPTGRVLYRVNNPETDEGKDLTIMDPMVKEAIGTGKMISGSTMLTVDFLNLEKLVDAVKIEGKKDLIPALAMEVVMPLKLKDQAMGLLVMGDVLNNDNRLVDELKKTVFRENLESGSATIYLNDIAVASSRAGARGRGIGDSVNPEIQNKVLKQGTEFIGLETIDGKNYMSAYVPIKDISKQIIGIYAVSVQEARFKEFQDYIRNLIIAVIGGALIFAILLTYITAGRITRPIEEITDSANKISLGDLDVSIKVRAPGDEIGKLAESLERMRISMKSAIERLRKR